MKAVASEYIKYEQKNKKIGDLETIQLSNMFNFILNIGSKEASKYVLGQVSG